MNAMPEGDTIHHAARRVGAALVGRRSPRSRRPTRATRLDRWPERLAGRAVRSVDAHGKHLFLRFEGDLTLHSHLRMGGKWGVYERGERWRRSPRRAWLVIRTDEPRGGAVRRAGAGADDRVAHPLRPAPGRPRPGHPGRRSSTSARSCGRLREDDPTRGIGDALLDQRNIAGIGNIWKAEACFLAGVDPWRRLGDGVRRRGAGDRARARGR